MKKLIFAVLFIAYLAACMPAHHGQPPSPPVSSWSTASSTAPLIRVKWITDYE